MYFYYLPVMSILAIHAGLGAYSQYKKELPSGLILKFFCGALIILTIANLFSFWLAPFLSHGIRQDSLAHLIFTLMNVLIVALYLFSREYLEASYRDWRYFSLFSQVFILVGLIILSNSILAFGALWWILSFKIKSLLTLSNNSVEALKAAKIKWLNTTLAMFLFCITSLWLINFKLPLYISELSIHQNSSLVMQLIVVCLFISVFIKTAQFPFHGWLVRVMEAPTPVSALLHAGVINLGAYLMLSLAPLFAQNFWINLFIGVCSLISLNYALYSMKKQTSIKSKLAFSTCAQMGFLLLEFSLGAYSLAVMHLIGHAFFKAHEFIFSGEQLHVQKRVLSFSKKITFHPMAIIFTLLLFTLTHTFLTNQHNFEFLLLPVSWLLMAMIAMTWSVYLYEGHKNYVQQGVFSSIFIVIYQLIEQSLTSYLAFPKPDNRMGFVLSAVLILVFYVLSKLKIKHNYKFATQ